MYKLFYRIYEIKKMAKIHLELINAFEDLDNPIDLFKNWFSEAEKKEINDPNAVAVATSDSNNQPNVKDGTFKGFK